jgi:hypothetical protein
MTDEAAPTFEEVVALKKSLVDAPRTLGSWHHGVVLFAEVADYLNAEPAQGPGEAMVMRRSDNDAFADVFFFA